MKLDIPPETALGAVFWSGVIFLLLSVFRIRAQILKAIPTSVRYGSAAGIGFIHNANFIVIKAPFTGIGNLDAPTLTFVAGLNIVSVLTVLKVKGALKSPAWPNARINWTKNKPSTFH